VDDNKLTGSLPPEWGEMTNLEALGMVSPMMVLAGSFVLVALTKIFWLGQ
jgi:hypothetical protein